MRLRTISLAFAFIVLGGCIVHHHYPAPTQAQPPAPAPGESEWAVVEDRPAAEQAPADDPFGDDAPVGARPAAAVPTILAQTLDGAILRIGADGTPQSIRPDGFAYWSELVVDAPTGRWATFAKWKDRDGAGDDQPHTLVVGDASGTRKEILGDPSCVARRPPCFETPLWFSADGRSLFAMSLERKGSTVHRYDLEVGARTAVSRQKSLFHVLPVRDRGLLLYVAGKHLFVTDLPSGRSEIEPGQRTMPITRDNHLFGVRGDELFYTRYQLGPDRRPLKNLVVARNISTGREAIAGAIPLAFRDVFPHPTRSTFLVGVGPEGVTSGTISFDLVELGRESSELLTRDVRQVFDVSSDGRYALLHRPTSQWGRIAVFDLAARRDVASYDMALLGGQAKSARFASAQR